MTPNENDRQFDVLQLYGDLVSEREDWSGSLVLACGAYAEIVPAAVSIANGTTLWLTDKAEDAKASMRRGEVDFIVNSLDEALRTLKNQIRRGKPLGVALTGEVRAILAEMVERGVLPVRMQLGASSYDAAESRASIETLHAQGMQYFHGPYREKDTERWQRSMMILHRKRYYAYRVHAQSLKELQEIDAQLLRALPEGELARRRWLQHISQYVRDTPQGGRWVWLTEEEYLSLSHSWSVTPEERP